MYSHKSEGEEKEEELVQNEDSVRKRYRSTVSNAAERFLRIKNGSYISLPDYRSKILRNLGALKNEDGQMTYLGSCSSLS